MNLTKEQIVALQDEIKKLGGREKYIKAELKRRGVVIERRRSMKDFTDKKRKEEYIKNRKIEEDVRTELKTLTWIAYKNQNISYLGEGIFWNDSLGVDFFDPYERTKRREDNDVPEIESVEDLIKALQEAVPDLDVAKLRWFCYHRDVAEVIHYETFVIPKKSGGKRYISAPLPQLKSLQNWILRNILVRMPTHEAAHGFIEGRSIVTNAAVHSNSQFVLSMDLKNFFPTLTFRRVKGIFRAMGYLEGIATLLALICTESPRQPICLQDDQTGEKKWVHVAVGPRCLPQGSPASPMLTNLASMRIDRRLTGFAQKYGLRYTRYADDLTFSAPMGTEHKKEWLQKRITFFVEDEGFQVHPDKTKFMGTGNRQEVTGLVVNDVIEPRVPRNVKAKLRAAIHNQEQGKPFYEDETLDTLLGYASFIYSAQPTIGKKYLDSTLELMKKVESILDDVQDKEE
jgi:RNA-directed DNA polymerase